jgi:hypothetical protein
MILAGVVLKGMHMVVFAAAALTIAVVAVTALTIIVAQVIAAATLIIAVSTLVIIVAVVLQDRDNLLDHRWHDNHLFHQWDLCPNLVTHPLPQWSRWRSGGWAFIIVEEAHVAGGSHGGGCHCEVVGVFI